MTLKNKYLESLSKEKLIEIAVNADYILYRISEIVGGCEAPCSKEILAIIADIKKGDEYAKG